MFSFLYESLQILLGQKCRIQIMCPTLSCSFFLHHCQKYLPDHYAILFVRHQVKYANATSSRSLLSLQINKCQNVRCPQHVNGPVNINYACPVFLSPDASLDTILGFLSTHLNIPKEKFEQAFSQAASNLPAAERQTNNRRSSKGTLSIIY